MTALKKFGKYEPKVHLDELITDISETSRNSEALRMLKTLRTVLSDNGEQETYHEGIWFIRYEQINRDRVVFKFSHAQALLLLSAYYKVPLNDMQRAYVDTFAYEHNGVVNRTFENYPHCLHFHINENCKALDMKNKHLSVFNNHFLKPSFYNRSKLNETAYKMYMEKWQENINANLLSEMQTATNPLTLNELLKRMKQNGIVMHQVEMLDEQGKTVSTEAITPENLTKWKQVYVQPVSVDMQAKQPTGGRTRKIKVIKVS